MIQTTGSTQKVRIQDLFKGWVHPIAKCVTGSKLFPGSPLFSVSAAGPNVLSPHKGKYRCTQSEDAVCADCDDGALFIYS